jgi:hypothetical protein
MATMNDGDAHVSFNSFLFRSGCFHAFPTTIAGGKEPNRFPYLTSLDCAETRVSV